MEVVDKKGVIIQTEPITAPSDKFMDEVIKPFRKIMVGVAGGVPPFDFVYFEVQRADVIDVVRMNQAEVSYSIMYNSRVDKTKEDILYIHRVQVTLV